MRGGVQRAQPTMRAAHLSWRYGLQTISEGSYPLLLAVALPPLVPRAIAATQLVRRLGHATRPTRPTRTRLLSEWDVMTSDWDSQSDVFHSQSDVNRPESDGKKIRVGSLGARVGGSGGASGRCGEAPPVRLARARRPTRERAPSHSRARASDWTATRAPSGIQLGPRESDGRTPSATGRGSVHPS